MAEVYMGALRYSLPTPKTVGEHPPLTDKPKALVMFFDTPEQCAAWERFLNNMPTERGQPADVEF